MDILLINDTSDSGNWGARATSYALKLLLNQTGDHNIETIAESELRYNYKKRKSASDDTKKLLKKIIPPIVLDFRNYILSKITTPSLFQDTPQEWEDFILLKNKISQNKNLLSSSLQKIKNADLVIIQGEGCIKGNTNHARMLLFSGFLSKKLYSKPTLMVNHTADFSHPILKEIAHNVYPLFDDIVFREPVSLRRNNEFCKCRLAADAAYLFSPLPLSQLKSVTDRPTYNSFWPDSAEFKMQQSYICIGGGSGLPNIDHDDDPVGTYSELIAYLTENFSQQLILTASGKTDLEIMRVLSEKFQLPLLGLHTPVQQAVDILGNADAYIGGRWHPSIFALSGGTPIIPLTANSFKMRALVEVYGLADIAIEPMAIGIYKEVIEVLLKNYLEQGHSLRNKLKSIAKEQKLMAQENVSFLDKEMQAPKL